MKQNKIGQNDRDQNEMTPKSTNRYAAKSDHMKIVGITGGVGSGKSVIMDILKNEYGAETILADDVAHDLMDPGQESYRQIIKAFGNDILDQEQKIDRQALAGIVFQNKEALKTLNNITHPNVRREIFRRIAEIREKGKAAFIAVEAALLLEEGYQNDFDAMWYVYADEETRIKRLQEGRGYTVHKSRDIMKKQLPEENFRRECDVVIDNHSSLSQTRKELDQAVKELLSLY